MGWGGAREGAGNPGGKQAIPTLQKRAIYEKFFVDELRAYEEEQAQVGTHKKRRKPVKRIEARGTHAKAIQGIVRMMVQGANAAGGARIVVHLDERLSGRIPAEVEAPPAMPPFVLMIGANGNSLALGYTPQGVVPGMEAFMPREVKALPASGNGHKNGKGGRR